MKGLQRNWIALGSAIAALTLAGCGNNEGAGVTDPAVTNAGEASQIPADVTGAALATRQSAEAFTVELRVDGAVKRGENRFIVTVTENQETKDEKGVAVKRVVPVTDATVRLLLTMPAMNLSLIHI